MITESEVKDKTKSYSPSRRNCRVSVVIPCYNHAQYLGEAIQSVLNQTCQDYEIIVVDDGSTDDTAQVVASFGQSVRYIYQLNAGLSAARNAGIRESTGDYLCFLDADDLWLPDFLATLIPVLDNDQRLGAVYCGSQFVDENASPLPQRMTRTVSANRLWNALTYGDFFPANAVLVRKSVFDAIGAFDESLNASEDWDMWLRISANYLFAGVPNVLASYRMLGNSMSRNLERMLESQIQVARKHFGSETGNPANWTVERQRAYAGIYLWQAIAHYQRNELDLGADFVQRTLITSPSITRSLDTFYALVCAEQPSGHVGDLSSLDLNRNAKRVITALDMIFTDPKIPIRLWSTRRMAYGTMYFALGIFSYGQRNLGEARKYMVQAVIQRPILIVNRQWALTFAKALLGRQLLITLVDWKTRLKYGRGSK